MNRKTSVFSIGALRYKLFKLFYMPCELDPLPYIPDCMGEFSPFLDPLHDDFGRNFTTCFLLDKEGNVGIFWNERDIDYVPYNILFNVTEYNQCIKLLYTNDHSERLSPKKNNDGNRLIRKIDILQRFALDEVSFKSVICYLKQGRIGASLEIFVLLFYVYFLLCFEKKIIHNQLLLFKERKKYYQNRGVFVFAPYPKYGMLIKLITPNKKCDKNIFEKAKVIGQKISISFREKKHIDISHIKEMWLQ